MTSFDVCKMKVYCSLKIGVKVGRFLKIVWKISNLNKSRRLIYKVRNFLTSGFEIYAIWDECLVNKYMNNGCIGVIFLMHQVKRVSFLNILTVDNKVILCRDTVQLWFPVFVPYDIHAVLHTQPI